MDRRFQGTWFKDKSDFPSGYEFAALRIYGKWKNLMKSMIVERIILMGLVRERSFINVHKEQKHLYWWSN